MIVISSQFNDVCFMMIFENSPLFANTHEILFVLVFVSLFIFNSGCMVVLNDSYFKCKSYNRETIQVESTFYKILYFLGYDVKAWMLCCIKIKFNKDYLIKNNNQEYVHLVDNITMINYFEHIVY